MKKPTTKGRVRRLFGGFRIRRDLNKLHARKVEGIRATIRVVAGGKGIVKEEIHPDPMNKAHAKSMEMHLRLDEKTVTKLVNRLDLYRERNGLYKPIEPAQYSQISMRDKTLSQIMLQPRKEGGWKLILHFEEGVSHDLLKKGMEP